MANSVNGFRFSNGYEDVFRLTDDLYTYVEAEPYMWADCMACVDYRDNGNGTFSKVGAWYGMSVDSLTTWAREEAAPVDVAATIIGAEFARAWAMDAQQYDDEEPLDAMDLLDVAACHVLDTSGAPDPFPMLPGESYHDYYTRWENALASSGVDFDA